MIMTENEFIINEDCDFDMEDSSTVNSKRKVVALMNGSLPKVRESCYAGVKIRAKKLMALGGTFDKDQRAIFARSNEGHGTLNYSVKSMIYAYNAITALYRKNMELAVLEDNPESAQAIAEEALADFRRHALYLADMIRHLTIHMEPEERALLVKNESMSNVNGHREDGGNNFAQAIIPQEMGLMVMKYFSTGEVDFAGEKLTVMDPKVCVDGVTLMFENGINDAAIVNHPRGLNGEYVIRLYNGSYYATKPLHDLIRVPEATDKVVVRLSPKLGADLQKMVDVMARAMADKKQFILTCAAGQGDRISILNDNNILSPITNLDLPDGRSALSDLFDCQIIEVDEILACPQKDKRDQIIVLGRTVGSVERKHRPKQSIAVDPKYVAQVSFVHDESI